MGEEENKKQPEYQIDMFYSLEEIEEILNMSAGAFINSLSPLKAKRLALEAAMVLGVNGMADKSNEILDEIEKRASKLNEIFRVGPKGGTTGKIYGVSIDTDCIVVEAVIELALKMIARGDDIEEVKELLLQTSEIKTSFCSSGDEAEY